MFSIVNQTELLVSDISFQFRLLFEFNVLTFDFLAPSILIQALSEEDDIGQHGPVVLLVHPVADSVQVKRKDFVNEHFLSILVIEQIIVPLPLLLVGLLIELVIRLSGSSHILSIRHVWKGLLEILATIEVGHLVLIRELLLLLISLELLMLPTFILLAWVRIFSIHFIIIIFNSNIALIIFEPLTVEVLVYKLVILLL